MFTDIVGSVALQNKLGTERYTRFVQRHDEIFKSCLHHTPSARILNETGDGFLVRFDTPTEAVNTALRLQAALHDEVCEGENMQLCIGLNLGAVTEMVEGVRGETRAVGMAINLAARVMDLAEGNQILMTRAVFDDARQFVREHPNHAADLQWPAHGRYLFKGNDEPIEIYEVGAEGMALLSPPEGGGKAKRAVAADEESTLGWRPGAGIAIPRMEDWVVEEKLGEGGFGEVWLARHQTSKEERVFKFCFDPERLRSFRRELTLFRLLRDALGKRDDIAALYDVSIEMPPFYLESEYVPDGNLVQWITSQGGMEQVSLETRLDLMARTARAVDAAHSVGIVHKDIKPSNVLIALNKGEPRPRLADFGIGAVTDASALEEHGITQSGFTQSIVHDSESGKSSLTQLYAPPEYLIGGQPDPKGDIYSLGIMIYQLVAGDLKRPLASGWRRDIEDSLLTEIIENCVDIEPSRRFDSASQLAERLETLEERRRQLQERERLDQLRQQARKRRRLIAAGCVVCLGLTVLSIILGTSYVRQKQATIEQERATAEAQRLRAEARRLASQSDFLLASEHMAQDRRSTAIAFLARSLRSDPLNQTAATTLFAALANHRFEEPIHPPLQAYEGDGIGRMFLYTMDSAWERAVTQDDEGMLSLFDLAANKKIGDAFDHRGEIPRTASFVADDRMLLAAVSQEGVDHRSAGSRLKLWDVSTQRLIRQEPQGDDSLRHVNMAADGSHWIVAKMLGDSGDYELQFWDLSDMDNWKVRTLPRPKGAGIRFVGYAADVGRFVCIARFANGMRHICVLDVDGMDPEAWKDAIWQDVDTLPAWISVSFQPSAIVAENGSRLAVPMESGAVRVYDLETRKLEREIENPNGVIIGLNLSPTGNMVAVGYFESGISSAIVWDLVAGKQMLVEPYHAGGIPALGFSPDEGCLVSGSMDGSARLWDIRSGAALTERLQPHNGWVISAAFSDDGSKVATMSIKGTLAIWERGGSKAVPTPILEADPGMSFWFVSPDGERMSANQGQQALVLRRGENEKAVFSTELPIISTMISSNEQLFIQQFPDVVERIHLTTQQREKFRIPNVTALFVGDVSADGSVLICGSRTQPSQSLVFRLDRDGPEPLRLEHPQRIMLASLSGDGQRAVTAGIGQTFLWDLSDENPEPRQLGGVGAGFTFSHCLNHDGSKLITGSVDGGVRVWDFASGEKLTRDFTLEGQVVSVTFSPNERLAAGLAVDQRGAQQHASVTVCDLDTEEVLVEAIQLSRLRTVDSEGLSISYDTLPQVRFSPDSSQLVAVWENGVSVVDLAPTIHGPVPAWVPDLAEIIAGKRLENGKVALTPEDQVVPAPQGDSNVDKWGAWLLQDTATRTISPLSDWHLNEFGNFLASDKKTDVNDLLQISPTDPRALAGVALQSAKTHPERAARISALAQRQLSSREFLPLAAATSYSQLAQAELQLRSPAAAIKLAEQAIHLNPQDIQSRLSIARALDLLDNESARQLAALLFEIMRPLGLDTSRTTLSEGFSPGAAWQYLDGGQIPEATWKTSDFDGSEWKSASAPFGFGDQDERNATFIDGGPDDNRHITTYFRKSMRFADPGEIGEILIRFQRDDGIAIHINGQTVATSNLPGGDLTPLTLASTSINGSAETAWHLVSTKPDPLTEGENILAVEVHQNSRSSSDLWFALELETIPRVGSELLSGDGSAVAAVLRQIEKLSDASEQEIRSIFADEESASNAFVLLAKAVRARNEGDTEGARDLLDKAEASATGSSDSPLSAILKAFDLLLKRDIGQ